jgi:hypothetical protein
VGLFPGFIGSICYQCKTSVGAMPLTNYYRYSASSNMERPAIDLSGNVWSTTSNSTVIYEVVGVAVPKVAPDSLGLKNGNYASKP